MAYETLTEAEVDIEIAKLEALQSSGVQTVRYGDTMVENMPLKDINSILSTLYQRKRKYTGKPLVKQYRVYGTRGY